MRERSEMSYNYKALQETINKLKVDINCCVCHSLFTKKTFPLTCQKNHVICSLCLKTLNESRLTPRFNNSNYLWICPVCKASYYPKDYSINARNDVIYSISNNIQKIKKHCAKIRRENVTQEKKQKNIITSLKNQMYILRTKRKYAKYRITKGN